MRVRVIRERMPLRQDFGDQVRMLLRVLTDDEERRARVEALQDLEQLQRVRSRRSVINRDPDFASRGREAARDRSPPLAIRHERRVEQQHVRNEQRQEREEDVRAGQRECDRDDRREKREAEQRGAHRRLI